MCNGRSAQQESGAAFNNIITRGLCTFQVLFIIKGNVAVYKVLNLEMLLYKVRRHVSTVKVNRPILTLRSRMHSRNVIARVLAIDRACCAGASKRSLPACLLSLSEKMSKRLPTRSIYLDSGQAAERV